LPKQTSLIGPIGRKSLNPWDTDDTSGWTVLSGEDKQSLGEALYFRRVPWLYRAVKVRCNAASHIPFAIINKDGSDYDTSDSWENKCGFMPNPKKLIALLVMSKIMTGRAYAFKETNGFKYLKNLVYCSPTKVNPKTGDTGLTGFDRIIGTQKIPYPLEQFVYIFDTDYLTESGPGNVCDATAAMNAAGVSFNVDVFVSEFFKRGAIQATVLSAEGADKPEAERLKAWWKDVIGGVKNAWTAFVMRGKQVVATVIGQGIEGLSNSELTKEKRQDISTALGIPESKLWSSAANYATAEQDAKDFLHDTVMPDCDQIEEALNEMVFKALGLRFEFRSEASDSLGRDARGRATAFAAYVTAGMKPSIAAQVVGLTLPEGIEYDDLDPEVKPEPPATIVATPPTTPILENTNPDNAVSDELKAWERFALKRVGKESRAFVTQYVPDYQAEEIQAALAGASTPEQIKAVFEAQQPIPVDFGSQIKRAMDWLEANK